ncbi:hypothetical protein PTSG_03151 [Salpingoeca rosetta]|uniref:Amidase domain-containing protein n=1 Tax=Salpingoeca rosetta (strain ATCC 50818 / BSB-021) TaxID=946362 RepID=F2U4D7_SALR5|nr:uncharacterized protein PTSG_03151 [Salpingoeca rosetta]EGD82503.1 hypothetical protein PTSG_03151 [Salpingoeca rosetta]|eukprot:XP_004995739.1 hypothetical protein PTSG_03151 [Salpingoeca rosetta]
MFVKPTPACLRAVEVAKRALESRGHELVEIEAPNIRTLALLYYAIVSGDGGDTVLKELENQDVDKRIQSLIRIVRAPQFVHSLARFLPTNKVTDVLSMTGRKTVYELWQHHLAAKEERAAFLRRWESARLDALVCVSSVMPAGRQGTCSELTPTVWPTFIFNLLNMPAGVVPVTHVTMDDDSKLNHYRRRDMLDTKIIKSCLGSEGLPVTAQVVALPYQGEKCLRVMKEIETVVGVSGPVEPPF